MFAKTRKVFLLIVWVVLLSFTTQPEHVSAGNLVLCPEEDVFQRYTVQRGDNLWAIARRAGVRMSNVIAVNKHNYPTLATNPGLIYSGWELDLPCKDAVPVVVSVVDGFENEQQLLARGVKYVIWPFPRHGPYLLDHSGTGSIIPTSGDIYELSSGKEGALLIGVPGNSIYAWMDIVEAQSDDPELVTFRIYSRDQNANYDLSSPVRIGVPKDLWRLGKPIHHDRWWAAEKGVFKKRWAAVIANKTGARLRFKVGYQNQAAYCKNLQNVVPIDWNECDDSQLGQ